MSAQRDPNESSSEDEAPKMPSTVLASEPSSPDVDAPPAPREEQAAAPPRVRTAKQHVLSWCQKVFHVPAEVVISFPKCAKQLDDAAALSSILSSKSPDVWRDVCDPKHLMLIRGREGKSVYCVFFIKDQNPSEERFIRLVPSSVCDKLFPKMLEDLKNADFARDKPKTERQRQREDVLLWRSKDINGKVQINPEVCTPPCPQMTPQRPLHGHTCDRTRTRSDATVQHVGALP